MGGWSVDRARLRLVLSDWGGGGRYRETQGLVPAWPALSAWPHLTSLQATMHKACRHLNHNTQGLYLFAITAFFLSVTGL